MGSGKSSHSYFLENASMLNWSSNCSCHLFCCNKWRQILKTKMIFKNWVPWKCKIFTPFQCKETYLSSLILPPRRHLAILKDHHVEKYGRWISLDPSRQRSETLLNISWHLLANSIWSKILTVESLWNHGINNIYFQHMVTKIFCHK